MQYFYRGAAVFLIMFFSFSAQAASIWFADDQFISQVDTGTNSITRSIPLDKTHELAVDASDSSLWVASGQQLSKLDSFGNRLLQIGLKPLDLVQPRNLVADPYDDSLWITDQNTLAHLNTHGQFLGEWQTSALIQDIALSLDQSLWLLGSNKQLSHYSAQGTLLAAYELQTLVQEEPKFLAVDSLSSRLWLAGKKQLVQFDSSNLSQTLFIITLPSVVTGIALDPASGALWVIAGENLLAYAGNGAWIKSVNLTALAIQGPQRLVYDPVSKSLWLGHKTGVSRLTTEGALVTNFPFGKPVQAIGVPPFMVTPTLPLIQPPQDALSNNPMPTITLGYDAVCSGQPCGFAPAYFSNYSLSALLNNNPIGNLFVFDPLTGQTSYTPASPLPEGANPFTAQATDGFGHLSNKIDTTFTIDTIAPSFLEISPQDGSIFTISHITIEGKIDDANATVVLEGIGTATNTTASGTTLTFRFPVTLIAGLNTFTVTAIDRAGNSTSRTLRLSYVPVSISISSPATGATIASDSVLVSGIFQGPFNTGITVNGIVAAQNANRFYAEMPLNPGANSVTATATTPEGITATQTISVSSSGTASIRVSVEPKSGIAPLKTTFAVQNNTASPISKIQIDFDGNGSIDYTGTDPNAPVAFTYAAPGVYQARITVTDSQSNVFTQDVLVSVQDGAQMDQMFTALLGGMNTALISGDVTKAGSYLNTAAKQKYLPVFQTLLPQMPQIIASYSPLHRISISGEIGEYAINRTIGGRDKIFLIYFLQDSDGVWRLDAM